MPCFYKFIVTDTAAFLSNPERVVKVLQMCGEVMQDTECGDDIRSGAVKILEVLLTQCQGRLDQYVPDCVDLLMRYFAQPEEHFEEFQAQLAVVSTFELFTLLYSLFRRCLPLSFVLRSCSCLQSASWSLIVSEIWPGCLIASSSSTSISTEFMTVL
jgi:hypothetical protein